jgi:hypothetical protein
VDTLECMPMVMERKGLQSALLSGEYNATTIV